MHLHNRIIGVLKNGSINTPGNNAVAVLASRLGVSVSAVRSALASKSLGEKLDLGNGNCHNTSFIGLANRSFTPSTDRQRTESKYAVDQEGRHYSGVIPEHHPNYRPVIQRLMTPEEWQERFPNDPYPVPQPESEPMTNNAQNTRMPTKRAAKKKVDSVDPTERQMAILRELRSEASLSEDGLVPTALFESLMAEKLQIKGSTVSAELTVLRKLDYLIFTKIQWQGESYTKPTDKLAFAEKLELARLAVWGCFVEQRRQVHQAVADAVGCSKSSVDNMYLKGFRTLGIYETTKEGAASKILRMQETPLTQEQVQAMRKLRHEKDRIRREAKKLTSKASSVNEAEQTEVSEQESQLEVPVEPTSIDQLNPTAGTSPPQSIPADINQLLRSLVEKAQADERRIHELETQNLEIQLRYERAEASALSLGASVEALSNNNDVLRAKLETPPPATVDQDLVRQAMSLLQT